MADAKIDMALDDIIKSNRAGGRGNRRGGRGGNVSGRGNQRQRGNNQRSVGGRIGKNNNNNNNNNNNRARGRGGARARNSFNQRNNNRSNNFRQQRGNRNPISGYNRRNNPGDKPTATYNPLSRDIDASSGNNNQQPMKTSVTPRQQQGSVFNKVRRNQPANNGTVGALRRRMVAAQRALNRATRTLAALPRIRQQRQRILQQPQQLRNIITRNRVAGGALRKRLGAGGRKPMRGRAMGRVGTRRAFV